jgi:hypothetical protein
MYLDAIECLIIDRILFMAKAMNFSISVHDGEEWVVHRCTDFNHVRSLVAATESTKMRFRDSDNSIKGFILFIHNNDGAEVIADYSDNDLMTSWVLQATS